MFVPRLRTVALAVAATFSLAACAYDDGYGYGGVSVGYGYYDYDDWYGYPAYGWYDGFYYPGTGFYVYDRGGHRHRWKDHHRRHWEGHRGRDWSHHRSTPHENWSGFDRNRSVQGSAPARVISRMTQPRQSWQGSQQVRSGASRGAIPQDWSAGRRGGGGISRSQSWQPRGGGGSMGQRWQSRRGRGN